MRHTSDDSPISINIATVKADFSSQESLAAALRGQDALLSCVPGGATDFASQKLLIGAAIAAGVKLFFASEYSANVMSPQYARLPTQFVGEKPRIRRYLEEKAKAGSIAWTALNGGPFFDLCNSFFMIHQCMLLPIKLDVANQPFPPGLTAGPAGFNIANCAATIYGTGNNLACWTPLPTIAQAVHNMLLPETLPRIVNRAMFICGVKDVTQNNILAALEAETGSRFRVEHVDVQKIGQEAMKAMEEGDWKVATRGLTITGQFDEENSAANFWHLVDNAAVGVTPVTVREAVKEAIEGMKAV